MSDDSKLTGTIIDGYSVGEQVDDNGFILTYRAEQPRLQREVALQTLVADHRGDERLRRGMAAGAQLMARLEHPNIVPVFDFGELDDLPYVVLRSMRGGLLRTRLQSGETVFSLNDAAGVVRQIASALDYVHSQERVHGDPSPANIGFDESGGAYITDFLYQGLSQEAPEAVRGSKRFMAPELWQGQAPTPASDQYALGCLGYLLACGQPPFDGPTRESIRDQHLTDPAPSPHERRAEVPPSVDAVLFRALAKTPADRYPAVLDFARAYEHALGEAPSMVFISYSRRDQAYVERLRAFIEDNRLPVWSDAKIEHGAQWFSQIHDAIKRSNAVVVVMTPEAEASEWVHKEILLAKRYGKPIFPVRLRGDEFAILIDVQFADVASETAQAFKLPPADFIHRLSRAVRGVV